MAAKYPWEEYYEQRSTQSGNEQKSDRKKYPWEEYAQNNSVKQLPWDDGTFMQTVATGITDRVNTWLKNHNNYIQNYQNRYSNRKNSYEDAYVNDSSDWLDTVTKQKSAFDDEADAIISYMNQYKGYLNADWVKEVKSTLTKARKTNSQIVDYSTKDHEWWNSFGSDQELVDKYGSAEGVYNYYQRTDGYNKQYNGLSSSELTDIIGTLEDGEEKEWLTSFAQMTDYEEKKNADTAALQTEIDALESVYKEAESIALNIGMGGDEADARLQDQIRGVLSKAGNYSSMKDLEKTITNKKAYLYKASMIQKGVELASVADSDPEFSKYSSYVDSGKMPLIPDYEDLVYGTINGSDAAKSGRTMATAWSKLSDPEKDRLNVLQYMTDEEKALYNYYYNKHGYDAAEEYLDSIVDGLNQLHGNAMFQDLKGNRLAEMFYGVAAGFDQFNSGLQNLFSDKDYIPTSATQYASGMVREDFNTDFGKGAYDLVTTTANMLPSILTSVAVGAINPAAGAVAGNALMGASAAGNAYASAINSGYDKGSARFYSTAIGASEVLLGQLIGGISKLGGITPALSKALSGIDNGIARFALQYGGQMVSEGIEEGLQEILDPILQNAILNADESVNWSEVAYSALLGALSAGVMEAPGTVIGVAKSAAEHNNAIQKEYGGRVGEFIQEGLQNDPTSKSYKLSQKYQKQTESGKTMTGQQIRKLLEANQDQITTKDMKLIQQAAEQRLTTLGQTEDLSKIAELATKWATGGKLSKAEKTTLASSKYGSRVANELMPKNIESGDYSTDWAESIGTKSVNALHYNIKNIVAEMAKAEDTAAYKSLESRVEAEEPAKVSNTGNAVIRSANEEIDLASPTFKQVGDNGVMLEANGKTVNANDIDFESEEQGVAINAIGKIEHITPAAASALYAKLDMEKPVMSQLNGMDEAFTYGFYNYSEADLDAGLFVGGLTQEQKTDAYKLGQYVAKNTATEKADAMKKMRTAAEAKAEKAAADGKEAPKAKQMTITYNEGGGKVVDFDKAGVKLTSKQKAAPVLARVMHDMGLGTNFELFSSYLSKTLKDDKGNPARVFLNDQGVEEIAYSGVYRKKDGTIRIDLNAYNGRQLTLNAMAHELTHFIQQWSTEKYEALADFLVKTYENTDMTMHERVLREQARLERIRKESVSYDEAYDEVVANAMSKMLDDGNVMEKLAELQAKDASLAQKLWEGLKKLLNKFFQIYSQESALFHDAADLMDLKAEFEQLQQMWAEAFVEASENFNAYITTAESNTLTEAGIGFDEDTRSVYSAHFSTAYKDEIKVGKKTFDTEALAKIVAKGTGRSIEDARKWVKSEMTIANIVLQNPEFLDFEADSRYEAIKKNSDYPQGTVDLSNLCPKREEFTAMFDRLQKKYPNRLFTAQDVADMRKILAKNDITVACGACFVEDRRQLIGEIADTYIQMWKEAVETGNPLQKTNAAGVKSDLLVTKALAKQYGLTAGTKIMAEDTYIPNQYDLTTYEGFKLLEKNHPTIAMGFNRYNNSRGQQSARLIEGRAEYNRQILGWSDAKVKSVNNNGGLRIFSFSDFEVVHLLDLVQVIIDCSARGVKIQGYTKIPAFAKLVRNTGVKLNRSLIPKGDYGYHMENGKVVLDYDTTEGIDIHDKNFMDESDNPNVGNIVIGINPTQIGAAMLDSFVDYIIPFHSNKAKAILEKLGTGKWFNYKESQHEKDISTGSASKHNVNIYTEVLAKYHPTNKVEFVNAFIKECKRQGKIPRYAEFLNVDENGDYAYREGYHKLLVDFKMFDKDGNILPQGNITPNLEEGFMKELLNAEIDRKQNYEFPQKVYDAIDKKFGEQHSSQETDIDTSGAVDYDNKNVDEQEEKTNETRKESGEAFDRRTSEELFRVAQKGKLRYAYRPYLGTEISERAKGAEKELKKLGIPVFIHEKLETNLEGITEFQDNADSAAIPGVGVFIPFNAVADSKDIVGHEGFHFLATSVDRADYVSVLVDNIDFASAGFISYYEYVQNTYFKKTVAAESKEGDDRREKKSTVALAEEIFAFITGDIHNGDPKGKVHQFIRDYDAVKNAWNDLLSKHSTGALYSSQETDLDSQGNQLTKEQQEFFKDSKVRDKDGKLLVVRHGTNEDFHIFDFAKSGKNGKAEGYGFYFSDDTEITSKYGGIQKEVYLNITKPLYNNKRTVNKAELAKLTNALIDFNLEKYKSDGLVWQDSFISNYVNTYDRGMNRRFAVQEFVNQIWEYNTNDQDLVFEIAQGDGKMYESSTMKEFYDVLTKSVGYDGIIAEWSHADGKSNVYVTFGSEQSKYTSNKRPTPNPDLRYSSQETDADYIRYDRRAILKESKVDEYLYDYAAKSSPKYAQAYIAYVRPRAFLKLTTDDMLERYHIADQAGELDAERLSNSRPGIYLRIDHETGKVTGHEGRHRMAAMDGAGIELVPVLLLDTSNKMSKTDIEQIYLHGQFDETAMEIVRDLIPLNYENRDRVVKNFATQSSTQRMGERYGLSKTLRFSSHETDNISNRDLLANAFEGVVQNSIEYKMLQDYKDRIKELNKLESKLSDLNREIRKIRFTDGEYDAKKLHELESEAKNVAKEINRHDWKLLNLEASEPLRRVIDRERKKASQETRDHVKQIQQNKKDRAEQAELRQKIRKKVRDLDKILNRGNKKQNVKEDMKGFVSKALELADYLFTDHVSNDELIRRGIDEDLVTASGKERLVRETEEILSKIYDHADSLTDEEFTRLDAKRKTNEDKLRDLLTAQRNRRLQTPVYNLFSDLVTEYSAFKNSSQDAVKAAYNPEVERFLRSYVGDEDSERAKTLKNMRVADMTTEELWKLDNAYQMVLHAVITANKLFVKGKTESIEQVVTQIVTEFGSRKIPDKKMAIAIQKLGNKIGWNYEKLYYALDRIGSQAFTDLIMNLANSENTVMQDVMEAAAFRDEMVKKYGFNNWDVNKEIDREFLDHTGKKFKLTLGQLMSLYAYSRREGAWDHIEYGGFVFGEAALTNPKPADSFKLSKEQCEAITGTLTKEQKGYVEDMQKFLSETMGGKGNEVSMMLYGIKMFGEKNYFPIHIAGQFKAQAQESQAKQAAGFGSMSNAGFTHAQNPKAKAPFVLEGFNDVWVDHVNEMSRYHGTVPALEDLRRVMNRSSYAENTAESTSVKVIMENHFGKEAVEYFDNLYREANSGAITDKLQQKSKKLLSLFRKNSVAYSLSVLVQQPASMVRAYAMIDRKYFGFKGVGAITSGVYKAVSSKWNSAYADAYNEMLKYAPGVTMTKEIGGFDTATGGSIRSYLLDTDKSFKQKWKTGTAKEKGQAVLDVVDNNPIANLPNVADKIAWIEIWNACKRETLAKHKDLAPTSDEFMKIVGDRFTEVIRATQVYDSIFAKSPMLKSKNLAVQMLVSFMNEPNTVANMAESAVRDFAKGNRMDGLKKAHVLVHSIIFTGLLKSLIYAMRDDDEDETYIEKYIESLTGSLMDDFNPFSYIPFARDVWSIAQGYDVERTDMAIFADAIGALNNLLKAANTDKEDMTEDELIELDKKITKASWDLVDALSAFAGIPMKNVRREINAMIDHHKIALANAGKTTAMSTWDTISEAVIDSIPFMGGKSKTDKLYAAIIEGDTEYINRMKGTYKTEDSYHTAVRKALRENDPRVKEAAQAQINGDPSKRVSIAKQIIADGFILDDVVAAINSEINAMTTSDSDSGAKKEKGYYTAADIAIEAANGDWASVREIKDDIIQTAQKNGKTKDEAEENFESDVRSNAKEAYLEGSLSNATAKKLLVEYAGMGEDEAVSRVSYWAFCKDNTKYAADINESQYGKYVEFAEPAGIPVDVYAQFITGTKGLANIKDKWGDVVLTKQDQVKDVIHALPLTRKQKDALYLATDYAESGLWDVPW